LSETAPVWLWLAIVLSGLYHGINPGMGWPLAVASGLMEKNPRALFAALWPLSLGHLSAMLVMLLPFALLVALAQWQHELQAAAGFFLVAFGVFRLLDPRHPRVLARIGPRQLALWSFVVAIAHGAGLMLVPIYLGLCQVNGLANGLDRGHEAAAILVDANVGMVVIVSIVHTIAMITAGAGAAWLVYRYLGLQFVARSWFNLDRVWAASLILVGAVALAIGFADRH
jgi:hypothetical protein